jgi:superkiller protein 3
MAWYDIGDIHVQLATFDQAIEAYEQVQQIRGGKQVGVTAAMAGAMLALGRQTAAGGFRERSRRAFHSAIKLAGEVLRMGEGHRPWAWKLAGDAAFELGNNEPVLEEAEDSANVLRPVLELLIADDIDRRSSVEGLGHPSNLLQGPVDLTSTLKSAVFAFAYRSYLCKNDRTADAALYDLATALHALAGRVKDKTPILKSAISAIRLALERDAGDERLWNALGVICASAGPQVAQHALVVSLELYAKVSRRW